MKLRILILALMALAACSRPPYYDTERFRFAHNLELPPSMFRVIGLDVTTKDGLPIDFSLQCDHPSCNELAGCRCVRYLEKKHMLMYMWFRHRKGRRDLMPVLGGPDQKIKTPAERKDGSLLMLWENAPGTF